jgi:hypothetical protein
MNHLKYHFNIHIQACTKENLREFVDSVGGGGGGGPNYMYL